MPGYPHVLLESPDHQRHLILEPREPSPWATWWRLWPANAGPTWQAGFSGHTAVEIIAGLTDALIRPTPKEPSDAWQAVTANGWTPYQDGLHTRGAVSPDGTARLEHHTHPGHLPYWAARVALDTGLGGQDLIWRGHLDGDTPPHLIAAFATALSNPTPVYRGHHDVSVTSSLVTQADTPMRGEQLAEAHRSRITAIRTAARAARRDRAKPPPGAVAPVARRSR